MRAAEVYDYIIKTVKELGTGKQVEIEILVADSEGELEGILYDLNKVELISGLLYINEVTEMQDNEIARVDHAVSVGGKLLNIELWESE